MRMTTKLVMSTVFTALLTQASPAGAATEIQWWHAMGGRLGEKVNQIAKGFNESQSAYKLIAVYKGNYTETMTSAIAASRSFSARD